MRLMIMSFGFLTIFAGILPMLAKFWKAIPASLVTGYPYVGVVAFVGIITLLYGIFNFGFGLDNVQQFVVGLYGLLVIFGGILPLLAKLIHAIPAFIVTGYVYYALIIIVGIGGAIYGATQF